MGEWLFTKKGGIFTKRGGILEGFKASQTGLA